MLTRLLDSLRARPDAAGAAAVDLPTRVAAAQDQPAPSPALPHPSAMLEGWRQEVARATIALRDRYGAGSAGARARADAERLLLRLAIDQEMVVRQPPPAAQEALAVAADPTCELPRLV
ncbi:MAG TPA: hypothetical protein VGD56_13465, partial [Gemmatirosa sp.]